MIEIPYVEDLAVVDPIVADVVGNVVEEEIPERILFDRELLKYPLREARDIFERKYLTEQLKVCNGRVGALAKLVGMERTHLYRKLKLLGVPFTPVPFGPKKVIDEEPQ